MNNKKLKNVFITLISLIGIFLGYKIVIDSNTLTNTIYNVSTIDSLSKDTTYFKFPDSLNNKE